MRRFCWRTVFGKALARRRLRAPSAAGRLRVEILEDRSLPSFFTPPTFAVGAGPVAQAVGDFNSDGKADLAIATQNSTTDDMNLMLGNGNGTFQAAVTTLTDSAPLGTTLDGRGQSSILSSDFNGDGRPDLVVVNNRDTVILVGRARTPVVTSQADRGR